MTRAPVRLILLTAALAAIAAPGCGKKGPPQAPLGIRPEAPRGLQARQRGETIWISVREPSRRTDGTDLDPGALLRIFLVPAEPRSRRPVSGGDPAAPPPRPSGAPAWILERGRWPEYRAGARIEVPISLASLGSALGGAPGSLDGRRIGFAVEVEEGRRKRSALAGPVALTLCEAPAPVASLEARMTEEGIRLRWPPVEGVGARANLYRGAGGAAPEGEPYASAAASEGVFLDRRLAPGEVYQYALRIARGEGTAACESTPATASARAVDTFPPSAPRGVAAVAEESLIRLFWSPGSEPDLAGYVVYRREGEEGEWRRMNEALLADTSWADTSVEPGIVYTYVVTAVDAAAAPNESGRSEPVSERVH